MDDENLHMHEAKGLSRTEAARWLSRNRKGRAYARAMTSVVRLCSTTWLRPASARPPKSMRAGR
jgi:hypothetical protein